MQFREDNFHCVDFYVVWIHQISWLVGYNRGTHHDQNHWLGLFGHIGIPQYAQTDSLLDGGTNNFFQK